MLITFLIKNFCSRDVSYKNATLRRIVVKNVSECLIGKRPKSAVFIVARFFYPGTHTPS